MSGKRADEAVRHRGSNPTGIACCGPVSRGV